MRRARACAGAGLIAVALAQFALASYSGVIFREGDFSQTIPGHFDAPLGIAAMPTFFRGPTQYLTVLPLSAAGSYDAVAMILLAVYAVLIVAVAVVMWSTLRRVDRRGPPLAAIMAVTIGFPPLLDAYLGREFEVIIVAAFAAAMWAATLNRLGTTGVLLAYASLYKYIPFIAVPYLVIRRWWRALAAFAVMAAAMLALTYLLFGFERFVNNNVPAKAAGLVTGLVSTPAFCSQVSMKDDGPDSDDISIRSDACRFSERSGIPAPVIYLTLLGTTLWLFALGMVRLSRSPARHEGVEQWRRLLELSLISILIAGFFYSHYYYLALLVLPLIVVLGRYLSGPRPPAVALALWSVAYVCLGAFLIPPQLAERWWGIDLRVAAQLTHAVFIGELVLTGLVLHCYLQLPARQSG